MWDALRKHRSMIRKYWTSGAELMSLLSTNEIVATQGWSGRIANLQSKGFPIGYAEPKRHLRISYAVFCLKKKKIKRKLQTQSAVYTSYTLRGILVKVTL